MIIIQSTITSIIFMLFPMMIYYVYVAHKSNFKQKIKVIIQELLIILCLFLNIFFFSKSNHDILILFIPLILAYLNNRKVLAILMSVILLEFYTFTYNFPFPVLMILFFTLYILNEITINNKTEKKLTFIFYFEFLVSITFILYYILYKPITMINYHTILKNLFLFYFCSAIIIYVSKRSIEILRFFMTMKDLEKEKRIQLSLFKITHEIKNPIAVIKGYLDMFDSRNIEKSEKYVSIIKGEVDRTLNILNDLSSLSKIKINKELIDISILFEDIKQVIIPFCNVKKVNYLFKIELEEEEMKADYERLKQVIINLLKNATEACNEKGNITCVVSSYLDKIYITIKDDGIGMTDEQLKNLFIPFNSSKPNGTGLGVCLSREILESHNGKLFYKSIKNRGTTVKIVLPIK